MPEQPNSNEILKQRYLELLPGIREVARKHGYAVAIHGSLIRDFDLVAVPWVDDAIDADSLAEIIRDHVGGIFKEEYQQPDKRSHGRLAWSIRLPKADFGKGYIDLSITNRVDGVCDCVNVEMGSYDNQIHVHAPAHMPKENGYCLDRCIANEIMQLWMKGITTTGCCCGHNKTDPYIGVIDKDIGMMKALGYKVRPNPSRPDDEDSFYPKDVYFRPEQQKSV